MNADAFRHFYNYHFAENRKVWEHVAALTFEQFTQKADYSRGSIREQVVHLLDVEDVWFSELQNIQPSDPLPETTEVDDRDAIRALWDTVEQNTRAYLANLQDDQLFSKRSPIPKRTRT